MRKTDPKKKVDPKNPKGTSGSAAELKRDKKGNLKAHLKKDFGGVTASTQREDRAARSRVGDSTFAGAPAPKSGKVKLIKSGLPKGGSKSMLKSSKKRVNKSSASAAAKRSARRLY